MLLQATRSRLLEALLIASVVLAGSLFYSVKTTEAAITVDNTSTGSSGRTSSLTISHTTGTGGNRVMAVSTSASDEVSAVTYNGTALTEVDSSNESGFWAQVWFLAEPDSGTHDVVITPSSTEEIAAGVVTYENARQTVGGSNSASSGSGTTASVTVTVEGDAGIVQDAVVSFLVLTDDAGTEIYNFSDLGDDFGDKAGGRESHSGSNATPSWSLQSDGVWAIAALEVVEEDAVDPNADGAAMMMGISF